MEGEASWNVSQLECIFPPSLNHTYSPTHRQTRRSSDELLETRGTERKKKRALVIILLQ